MVSKKALDLIERVGLTFIGAFIAVYIYGIISSGSAIGVFTNGELLDQALVAGTAAIFPLVTGLIGFKIGDKETASIITTKKTEEPPVPTTDVPLASPAPIDDYSQEG
jgi:hypothetical protein